MLIYALRDAEISQDPPGHTVVIHYRDIMVSFASGSIAAIASAFGVFRAIRNHSRRWTMLTVYAILTLLSCFPAFVIAQQFLLVTIHS